MEATKSAIALGAALALLITIPSCHSPVESQAKMHLVRISAMKFQPEELWLDKGDTVKFVNEDMVAHDVTEEQNKTWTSGRLEKGQTWSMIAEESTDYFCSLHKVMKGKLSVRVQ